MTSSSPSSWLNRNSLKALTCCTLIFRLAKAAKVTYSQSTNPASPYYADQTERFSKKEWISDPFTDAAIKADPKPSSKSISQQGNSRRALRSACPG